MNSFRQSATTNVHNQPQQDLEHARIMLSNHKKPNLS